MADYNLEVTLKGFNEFLSRLNAGGQIVSNAKKEILTDLTFSAQSRAQRESPRRTGVLASSITSRIEGDTGRVGTNISYARHQEYGTKPHVITIKRARVLTDRKKFFGRRVMHPGFKGKFFMKKGLEEAKSKLSSVLSRVKQQIISSLSF